MNCIIQCTPESLTSNAQHSCSTLRHRISTKFRSFFLKTQNDTSKIDIWKIVTLVEVMLLVGFIGLLISSLTVHKLKHSTIWSLRLWIWCVLVISIFCGRLIAEWVVKLVVFLIGKLKHFAMTDEKSESRVLYIFYGVKKSVQFFLWLGLVSLAWGLLFDLEINRTADTNKAVHRTTRGIIGCLIGVAIWVLKTFLVKLVGSLHASKLFDMIEKAIRNRKILTVFDSYLRGKSPGQDQNMSSHDKKLTTKKVLIDGIYGKKSVDLWKPESGNTETDKIGAIIGEIEDEAGAKDAAEKIFDKLAMLHKKYVDIDEIFKIVQDKNVRKDFEKKAEDHEGTKRMERSVFKDAAVEIFAKLALPDKKYVDIDELFKIVQNEKNVRKAFEDLAEDQEGTKRIERSVFKDAAAETFVKLALPDLKYVEMDELLKNVEDEKLKTAFKDSLFYKSTKKVKRSVFKKWLVEVYIDHRSLNGTLKYSKLAIEQLNRLASGIVLVIIVIVWLLFMGILTTKVLVFISSQLLLAAVIFGSTCKTAFESIIFVFVMHPFDIGDRCEVDKVQMIVEELNILNTIFLGPDGKKIYYPNSVLACKPVSNLYRSPPMGDSLEFAIDLSTSKDTIKNLQKEIKKYLNKNERRWKRDHNVEFKEIDNVNKLKMALYVTHTVNYHHAAKRASRRSHLVMKMKSIFERLGIKYTLLPQQVQLIM